MIFIAETKGVIKRTHMDPLDAPANKGPLAIRYNVAFDCEMHGQTYPPSPEIYLGTMDPFSVCCNWTTSWRSINLNMDTTVVGTGDSGSNHQ